MFELLGVQMMDSTPKNAELQALAGKMRTCLAGNTSLLDGVGRDKLAVESNLDFDFIKVSK